MKKIGLTIVFVTLVFLMIFPVEAVDLLYYSDSSGLKMMLPSGFYEVEGALEGATVYRDSNDRQINFTSSDNNSKVSFVDLTEEELKDTAKSANHLFVPKNTDYTFVTQPEAENVKVNGYKGVRIKAVYSKGEPYVKIYSTIYFFSTENNIYGLVFISTQSDSDFWYTEALETLRIEGKIYEEKDTVGLRNILFGIFKIGAIILVIVFILYGFFSISLWFLEKKERRGRK